MIKSAPRFAPSASEPSVTRGQNPGSSLAASRSSQLPPTIMLNPTGVVASSSAHALQISVSGIIPIIQSYIDHPEAPKATDAINAIKGIQPKAQVTLLCETHNDLMN